ncbi:hypothetical protein H7H37_06345 [Mycolicibacterium insubricum]|nr:hypothetical protein [Mycolicibacterium insubricum]
MSIPPLRPGARVLVAGAGMTGRSVLAALEPLGVQAVLTDDRVDALTDAAHGGVEVHDAIWSTTARLRAASSGAFSNTGASSGSSEPGRRAAAGRTPRRCAHVAPAGWPNAAGRS